ncbi:hypothetical protein IE077_000914 [Cardiosporidium cionae]|uniref:Uncharacterized protein n=1 Tax=Cardiosporidium cionae TaxID=476202 RepID=A0ABQ7J698_9APIC|nr:hypothetical protein IE077_000914 [Cardiosporidium cionae]|eukprot:KAF8819508.1 hypothetical protein IE077_000914 [Cardiosporidium cionae]
MEMSNYQEQQPLTGNGKAWRTRSYSRRSRQKAAAFVFLAMVALVVAAVVAWVLLFKPFPLGCNTQVSEKICKSPLQNFFNESMFSIVDNKTDNYLFRSNVPMRNNYTVDMAGVMLAITSKVKGLDSSSLRNYTIVFYSLLNVTYPSVERCQASGMFCSVSKLNQTEIPVKVLSRPISGDINPYNQSQKCAEAKSLTFQKDDIIGKIKEINYYMDSKKKYIVIIHGEYGKDRTGELVGAYRLQKGQSLNQVWKQNSDQLVMPYINGMMWYCLHLQATAQSKTADCFNIYQNYSSLNYTHKLPDNVPTTTTTTTKAPNTTTTSTTTTTTSTTTTTTSTTTTTTSTTTTTTSTTTTSTTTTTTPTTTTTTPTTTTTTPTTTTGTASIPTLQRFRKPKPELKDDSVCISI